MKITVLGCRGSYPVAHPDVVRYGGDTTCIYVSAGDNAIVLDAGTGIRKLEALPAHLNDVHLFITHLHWDHIIGFPHWSLLHTRPDITLHLYSLQRSHDRFYAALEQSISQPLYEFGFEAMAVNIEFHELVPGEEVVLDDETRVTCALTNHPYRALGYRLDHGHHSLGFIPDTAPFDRYLFDDHMVPKEKKLTASERSTLLARQDALVKLISGVDWLMYDCALTPEEYEHLPHWGHSTAQQAAEMAQQAEVGELILFHHAPQRTDAQVDAILAAQQAATPRLTISAAFSGMIKGA